MEFNEFVEELKRELGNYLGGDYSVEINTIIKNNDVEYTALNIREKNVQNIVPAIYLEDYYERFLTGISIVDICNSIIAFYKKQVNKLVFNIENYKDFNYIKERLVFKLVNYERNSKYLKKLPHKKFLDFAIVYYVILGNGKENNITAVVNYEHLKFWGIEEDILYGIAYKNTLSLLGMILRSIKDIMYEIIDVEKKNKYEAAQIREELDRMDDGSPLYVLTNSYKTLGAVNIVYDYILKEVYKQFMGGFYILPSSIHEVILVPEDSGLTGEELKAMVRDVNYTEVDYQELLSDNIYYYDGEKLTIKNE